jgi:hypothetical protein
MLIEMSIKGLMLDPSTSMPIVLLRDMENQRVLPIWVGPVEANAIALHELGARLRRIIIADLRDNTFYAYLELDVNGEVLLIDARPSDAIALSVRTKAPVFVDTRVLDHAKAVDVSSDQADQERLQRWLESLDPDDLGYKM